MTRPHEHATTTVGQSGLVDLVVIGGGINGAGIARDAAGRGLSVVLCEQDDLAAHTSSASTKLIHGGLRYLEHYEFRLVRKALAEREVLLRAAPHIIRPLRFVVPHESAHAQRPAWLIRLGLFFYDHLARRKLLAGSRAVRLARHPAGAPLLPEFSGGDAIGFVYSDGWVDDARLVVLNALDAQDRGARILTRTRCVAARPTSVAGAPGWCVTLRDMTSGAESTLNCRALVNAAGPWVAALLKDFGIASRHNVRLVKGSHIVVDRLFEHDHAYLFQNPDGRVIFAIPYENRFTLIGTTDVEYHGDPADVHIDTDETAYLCAMANRYFRRAITPADVRYSYSGVRPLLEDDADNPSAVTRDYLLELNTAADTDGAPVLSVFGGKITTYRKLAEEALDLLMPALERRGGRGKTTRRPWTEGVPLPGGDLPRADFDGFLKQLRTAYPWLPEAQARRYAHAYGTRCLPLLDGAQSLADLGQEIVPGLLQRELTWLCETEWVRDADDLLWRRSKLGLHLTPCERATVANAVASTVASTVETIQRQAPG